jgi:GH15 family glucan-1,4-alpha-glucosidase
MKTTQQPSIRDLAIIGDQKSCAFIDKQGTVVWYCLWRFDQDSLFSLLIDKQGGFWSVDAPGKSFQQRFYKDSSAVLVSEFAAEGGSFTVTDFMPTTPEISGISRVISPSPVPVTVCIFPTPDYNRSKASLQSKDEFTVFENASEFYIKASHPLKVKHQRIELLIPAGEAGWCVIVDDKRNLPNITGKSLLKAQEKTEEHWQQLMSNLSYKGPYQGQMLQSYRAIQLMTHADSGGILAAGTTSLPEIVGLGRNYDYRYVWLRDTAMDVSAILRAGSKGIEAKRFLDFLCTGRDTNKKDLFVPFYDLDNKTAPFEDEIPGTGYKGSTPLRIGNNCQ